MRTVVSGYSRATFEQVIVENQMKIAELRLYGSAALSRTHYAATQKREAAQQRLKEHEATHAASRASSMG